jgi:hypothetical protein
MVKLTKDDFKFDVPDELVKCLNEIDAETNEIENRLIFCREHAFLREAEYLNDRIRNRTSVFVHICNSLGKYF